MNKTSTMCMRCVFWDWYNGECTLDDECPNDNKNKKTLKMNAIINKEKARTIYNLYSQIETTESIINELKEFIKQYNEGNPPPVIPDNYTTYGSIEISIPYFESGQFKKGGARVFNISYPAAMKVLKSHVRCIKNKLKKELSEVEMEA